MRLLISGSWVRAPRWAEFFFFVNFKGRKSTFLLSPFCSDGKFLGRFFLNICVHFWGLKLRKVTHIYDLWAVHDQNMTSFTLWLCGSVCARLAHLVEHETLNIRVVDSSPTLGGSRLFFCQFKGRKSTFSLSPFCSDSKFLERFFLNICVHFCGLKLRKVTHIYDL